MKRIAVLLLAASLAGSASAQTAAPIRIGMLGFADTSALPLFAQASGIFKKYGLDTSVTSYNNGAAIIAAVAGGSLELGFSNITSAVAALQNGIPVMALAPGDLDVAEHETIMLVKPRGSKLRTGSDLAGKVVAVTTLGGTLQLAAETWIDKSGGDSHAVRYVEMPSASMPLALKQGRVDAAMLGEELIAPNRTDVEILGNAFAAIGPAWSSAVFVASKAWVAEHPDAARRFVAAMYDAARWANTHQAETARIFAPVAGVDAATMRAMVRATYAERLSRALLQPPIDAAVKYGALKQPFDTGEIVSAAAPYQR
jgi:NitT/TauT family transport system substrate-binding protein